MDEGRCSLSCDDLLVLFESSHIYISALVVVQNCNLISGKWTLITYIEIEERRVNSCNYFYFVANKMERKIIKK